MLGTSKLSIKMTQAFVQKRKNLERTISTIQIPKTKNSIDEEEVKRVLTSQAKAFFDTDSNLLKEKSEKSYKLASLLNKALISLPCLAQHKVVVYVLFMDQWGQGLKSIARCLWDNNCDRVISTNIENADEVCCIQAFCSKISEDSDEEIAFDD